MPRQRNENIIEAVGGRVAQARRDRGFTQEQLAEAVGLEPVTLSRWETGHRALSLSTLASIASVLGVSLGDLLDVGRQVPAPAHSPEEAEMIRLFGKMTPSGRDVLLRVARELAQG
jgi:transcriptional regulator with XRE-family HTH domain